MGRRSTGRNLEGAEGSGTCKIQSTLGTPTETPPRPRELWARREGGGGRGKELRSIRSFGRCGGPLCRPPPLGASGRTLLPARRGPRCRRRGFASAVGAEQLPPSEPPASAAAFAPGGGPARREPGPLSASELAAQSALLAAVAAEAAAAARLARLPPSARPAEATWAGAAGNFEKLSRSQACHRFEGKPRLRPTPSQIRVCGAPEGSQLPFQAAPGQRQGKNRGRGRRVRWGPSRALGGADRDAGELGLTSSQPCCPSGSAGIAPVGGLRAAFWVARHEPGRDHFTAIAR